jgi:hypothetical protein
MKKKVSKRVDAVKIKQSLQVHDTTPPPFPKKYFCLSLVGSRFAGKTNLINWLILNVYRRLYDSILVLSPSAFFDPTWTAVQKLPNIAFGNQCNDEILDGILAKQKTIYTNSERKTSLLLIIDDFGSQAKQSSKGGHRAALEKLATTGRHFGLSLMCSFQHAFQITPVVRLNTTNWILFRLNLKEFRKLSEELRAHLTEEEFVSNCMESTREKYKFLYVNFQTNDESKMFMRGFG